MQAFKIETSVEQDGSLTIRSLPFKAGERVEVIILPATPPIDVQADYPFRGTEYRYIDPTEPVAEADWEALK